MSHYSSKLSAKDAPATIDPKLFKQVMVEFERMLKEKVEQMYQQLDRIEKAQQQQMVSHMHRKERVQGFTNKYSFVPDKQHLSFAPLMPRQNYEVRVSLHKNSDQKKNIEKESKEVTSEKESEQKKTSEKDS